MLHVALLVAISSPRAGVELPTLTRGDLTARATVRVADEGAGPGRARATFTVTVEGPPTLQVEGPQLEDALAAWRVAWEASSWSADGTATWEISLGLTQVKPGAAPLPGVRLRARARPGEDWQDVSWLEPLHEPRDVAPLVELPPLPPSPWPRRLAMIGSSAILLAALGLGAWWWRREGGTRAAPEPAWRRALARLGDGAGVEEVTAVLREFLQEQGRLPASRLTTAELVARLEGRGDVPAGALAEVRELLHLGDLVKFAGHAPAEAERAEAVRRARALLECLATWTAGEKGAVGEAG